MEIVKISAIGIITAFCVLILKDNKSEVAVLVGIAGGCIILLSVIDYFVNIVAFIENIADKSGIPQSLMLIVFKVVGVGYLTDFSAGIVEDAGQKSLSEKIVLAGKILIMIISLPVITLLFDTVSELLG